MGVTKHDLKRIVEQMTAQRAAIWFLAPVDENLLPEYSTHVWEKMDLGSVLVGLTPIAALIALSFGLNTTEKHKEEDWRLLRGEGAKGHSPYFR